MTEPADSAGGAEGVVPVGDAADQGSGYRPGETAYRRVIVALFAAGVATFAALLIRALNAYAGGWQLSGSWLPPCP